MAGPTRDEVLEIMQAHGLAVAPVQTFEESAKDPHVLERDMLQDVEFDDGTSAPSRVSSASTVRSK